MLGPFWDSFIGFSFGSCHANESDEKFQFRLRQDNTAGEVAGALPQYTLSSGGVTIEALGFLEDGGISSLANGVSPDGKYVVGWSFSLGENSGNQAFIWSEADGMVGLGDLPGGIFFSEAMAVSNNGVVVGTSAVEGPGASEAFRWTQSSGMVSIGTLGGTVVQAFAEGISADGTVIVGQSKNPTNEQGAFRWTAATGMVEFGIGTLHPSHSSHAFGISGDGTTIVGRGALADLSPGGGWSWTQPNGFERTGTLPGDQNSLPLDASWDGSVVVGRSAGRPFRWTAEEGIMDLGAPDDVFGFSTAFGVSADGSIVVGATGDGRSLIWDSETGMRDLKEVLEQDFGFDLTGWELDAVSDISADGRVLVGYAHLPDEIFTAYRVTFPIPEPTTFTLAAFVLLGFAGRWRRR